MNTQSSRTITMVNHFVSLLALLIGGGLITAVSAQREPMPGAVHALFDLASPSTGPFPSDWFTVQDPGNNGPGIVTLDGVSVRPPHFNDNMPWLRDGLPLAVRLADGASQDIQSPVVNTVAGAIEIQEVIKNIEWVGQPGDAPAYAFHLRKSPLPGVPAKSVVFQIARGDQTGGNPNNSRIVRAGDLADRTTFYRHDLAFAEDSRLPKNPHQFIAFISSPIPLQEAIARGAQEQIARFFASDGQEIIHPEPARFFEVPIVLPLPEDLGFIP